MAKDTKELKAEKTEAKTESADATYYEAVGRRRESTARVRLYVTKDTVTFGATPVKKGDMIVNNKPAETYFASDVYKKMYLEPFRTTNSLGRFAVNVKTRGGGLKGQLGSVILGISRALEKVDKDKFRPILKKRGFLSRDSRIKQRRKAGFAGKARAKKQSPKR